MWRVMNKWARMHRITSKRGGGVWYYGQGLATVFSPYMRSQGNPELAS